MYALPWKANCSVQVDTVQSLDPQHCFLCVSVAVPSRTSLQCANMSPKTILSVCSFHHVRKGFVLGQPVSLNVAIYIPSGIGTTKMKKIVSQTENNFLILFNWFISSQ